MQVLSDLGLLRRLQSMKIPCPTCDRPIDPNKPCRDCSTLATFEALRPIDWAGRGDFGYESLTRDYGDSDRPPRRGPRFLCLHDLELLTETDVDAHGVEVVGEDDDGIWVGTRDAPCIVPGGGETLFILHGHRHADAWTGFYIGSEHYARAAVPEGIRIEFVEEIPVNPIERYLSFR